MPSGTNIQLLFARHGYSPAALIIMKIMWAQHPAGPAVHSIWLSVNSPQGISVRIANRGHLPIPQWHHVSQVLIHGAEAKTMRLQCKICTGKSQALLPVKFELSIVLAWRMIDEISDFTILPLG